MLKSVTAAMMLFCALASFAANAQMADRLTERPAASKSTVSKPISTDAVAITREMTSRLHLNEGQFLKLLPLNRTKVARLNSIHRQYKNDEATRVAKEAELEAQYEKDCSRILTPSQLSQLQQENGQPATAPTNAGNGLG
ncbi:hypothetical protein [Hymenobacter terrenus]|uniref:hypothetical protein n=1 Tax=Hymenobacter terrenus TaxID=1629124 RepID=UPI000A60DD99|nr:hypothetical protein [Hymenobacter terrenus]